MRINKITLNQTVDYAAEELKRCLSKMMPTLADIEITHQPNDKTGLCLGLMQDFGLDVSDANDTVLDDIIYIDADANGGIIAGDNPRAVLLAVYEFLRQNGCRWLFPGEKGEFIPVKSINAVKYRHMPSMRYRGPCIEGATSREIVLDTISFLPKVGMNLFMLQFFNPSTFYKRYYDHKDNIGREPETVSDETVLQWKSECEAEMSKRGIQFHDIGHGWTAAPFGIDVSMGWEKRDDDIVPEDMRQYLAEMSGRRGLYDGISINTQFCMSSQKARELVADYIADYAEAHTNVDYIHVWLADAQNNHCECESCRKKTVSDWYVILLNDIDKALTKKGLDTRIVFIAYTDTTWAPESEVIANPDRFTLMLAPITRSYTRSVDPSYKAKLLPYSFNNNTLPKDLDTYLAYFDEWKKKWPGANVCFEYHFWRPQIYNPTGIDLAKCIFEDAEAYKLRGIDGMIACGSQRSYFPNGLAYYVFARKQFDLSLTFDEIVEDYFSCAYGEDWINVKEDLVRLNDAFGSGYMAGEESEDESISAYYSPQRAEKLIMVPQIVDSLRRHIEEHKDKYVDVQTESFRILSEFIDYAELLSNALIIRARGLDDFDEHVDRLKKHMSSREIYIERYYEHYIATRVINRIFKRTPKTFSFT